MDKIAFHNTVVEAIEKINDVVEKEYPHDSMIAAVLSFFDTYIDYIIDQEPDMIIPYLDDDEMEEYLSEDDDPA